VFAPVNHKSQRQTHPVNIPNLSGQRKYPERFVILLLCLCILLFLKEGLLAPTILILMLIQKVPHSVPDDCLFSKIFHPRKRGKMAILGP